MKRTLTAAFALAISMFSFADVPPVSHPQIGTTAQATDGSLTMKLIAKKQNYGGTADTRDTDINSPKSINIHPDGSKYYVNSLEGCTTISYDFKLIKNWLSYAISSRTDAMMRCGRNHQVSTPGDITIRT